jgi:hypothetical protein
MVRRQAIDRDTLLRALADAPAGLGLEDLTPLFPDVPRRTLQRHLAQLADATAIRVEGRTRARRYFAMGAIASGELALEGYASDLPLSLDALTALRQVTAPIAKRRPVGYRRDFLERYQPNVTRYLPAPLCHRLHELGRAPTGERPAGTYARQIFDRLLIDLSWASSALEGNTYSRLDTQNLLQFGQAAAGKDALEAQMIVNHKAAIEMLVENAGEIAFDRYTIQNLHALLAENLLPDPGAGGRLRRIEVAVSGTTYTPTSIPQVIEEYFDMLLAKASAISDPFEQSFFGMVHLPYLQPFDDVNKRVSRLAANIPLIRDNLAPLSFVDVPRALYIEGTLAVYELNRIEPLRDLFAWAYERSCQRYTVLRDALPVPDPLRLRFRDVLRQLVAETVNARLRRDDLPGLRQRAATLVDAADADAVAALLFNELHQLHEGNIARYGLRPGQFREWLAVNGNTAR